MGGGAAAPVDEASAWKEFKDPNGRPYYHNRATNKTTYVKPDCLKSLGERTLAPCKWKEYPTADGKKYFSDGVKSVWTEPPELTEWKAKLAALEAGAGDGTPSNDGPPPAAAVAPVQQQPASEDNGKGGVAVGKSSSSRSRRKPVAAPTEPLVFNNDEDRLAAFHAMLVDYEITSTYKWGSLAKLCSDDPRWPALKTTGQRKQAFAEWQTKRAKHERQQRRAKQRKARDNFLLMLAQDTTIDLRTRWREAQQRLNSDDRFSAVDDDREREDLFNEFVMELARKDDEEKRTARKSKVEGFVALLQEHRKNITVHSRWPEVRADLEKTGDPRFAALDEVDRRSHFHDLVAELRKVAEAEARERQRKKREEEEAKRAAFRALLKEKVGDGSITAFSKWRDAKLDLEKEPLFVALDGVPGSTTRELFEDVVDELQQQYRANRKMLRDLADDSRTSVKHDSTFEDFLASLRKEEDKLPEDRRKLPGMSPESPHSHVRAYFDELHKREVAIHQEEQRRKKKREDRFRYLLEDYYYRSDHIGISWKEAEYDLKRHSAYEDLREADRTRLFAAHMADLERKMGTKKKKKPETTADAMASADGTNGKAADAAEAPEPMDGVGTENDVAAEAAAPNCGAAAEPVAATAATVDADLEDGEIEVADSLQGSSLESTRGKRERPADSTDEAPTSKSPRVDDGGPEGQAEVNEEQDGARASKKSRRD